MTDPAPKATEIALVHLVRRGNPPGWLARFLASLRRFPPGHRYRLVLILKGFEGDDEPVRIQAPEADFIAIDDSGFDIGAYRQAAGMLDAESCLFLNSHSAAEAPNWLARLAKAHALDGTGAAGASGSWERHSDDAPFANPHLRTNGFLIARTLFLSLAFGPLATKRDGNLFEGGPNSMTRQIESMGLAVRVAGRDGRVFGPEDWPKSGTFRSGNQQNLLLSDNRTREWQGAFLAKRRRLARMAFGDRAVVQPQPLAERFRALLGR